MYYKGIFTVLRDCYINLEGFKNALSADQMALKQEIDLIQASILGIINPENIILTQNQLPNDKFWDVLEANFEKSNIFSDPKKLDQMIKLAEKIQSFASDNGSTFVQRVQIVAQNAASLAQDAINYLNSYICDEAQAEQVEDKKPITIPAILKRELKILKQYELELETHGTEIISLQEKDISTPVEPLLNALDKTDASRLVTVAALPHVEECMKQHFAYLFEYACCINELINKLTIDDKSKGVLKTALVQILNELNIPVDDFKEINANTKKYQIKQQEFIDLKIPKDDCLNIAKLYENQGHIRKNLDHMFATLNKAGLQNNVLVTSFKSSYDACEVNQNCTKYVLENVQFVRDQAKKIPQIFDHPLLKIKGYDLITLKQVLPALGITEFIKKNIQALNYKDLSDLVRVRRALEANDLVLANTNDEVEDPTTFTLTVDLGPTGSLDAFRSTQGAHLKKYSTICEQQLQMATILLSKLQPSDHKLQQNLQELRKVYTMITKATDLNTNIAQVLKYNYEQHRQLHAALNALCTDFYPEVDPKSTLLLICAGNIQKKFDSQISSNDLGYALISNSALNTYSEPSESAPTTNFVKQQVRGFVASLNIDSLETSGSLAANLASIATTNVGLNPEIKDLNKFANSLQQSELVSREILDRDIRERDTEVFDISKQQPSTSFLNKSLNYIVNTFSYLSAFLAIASPMYKAKTSDLPNTKTAGRQGNLNMSKLKVQKALIKVQLEQHIAVLEKSLQLAIAMRIEELDSSIAKIYTEKFGCKNGKPDPLGLDENAKSYFKVKALQMAILTIDDPELREQLHVQLNIDKSKSEMNDETISNMSLSERKKYIKRATDLLARHADRIKIDAFFNQSKEEFERNISSAIAKKKLTAHGLTAQQTINWLLATPATMEMTKSICMISPYLNGILKKTKQHFANLYRTGILIRYMQDALYVISGKTLAENKILAIHNSPKRAARFYIYDYGKMELDLDCADRIIGILGDDENKSQRLPINENAPKNATTFVNLMQFASSAAETLGVSGKPENATINPYNRNKSSIVKSAQEESARLVVELLNLTLNFIDEHVVIDTDIKIKRAELNQILLKLIVDKAKPTALEDDTIRNELVNNALSILTTLSEQYQFQKNAHCFEFLTLLRYSIGTIGPVAKAAIQLEEYMSYHGVTYSEPELKTLFDRVKGAVLTPIQGTINSKVVGLFSGSGSIDVLQNALELMPKNDKYTINSDPQAAQIKTPSHAPEVIKYHNL